MNNNGSIPPGMSLKATTATRNELADELDRLLSDVRHQIGDMAGGEMDDAAMARFEDLARQLRSIRADVVELAEERKRTTCQQQKTPVPAGRSTDPQMPHRWMT